MLWIMTDNYDIIVKKNTKDLVYSIRDIVIIFLA